MQSDSVKLSTFEHIKESSNQAVAQSSTIRSYDCIKCPLIFKSKVYLYEHLSKVHFLEVDAALRGAGLKYADSNAASSENCNSRRSGQPFKCQFCDFKTHHQDVLNRHEKVCQKTEEQNLIDAVVISEDAESEVLDSSTNQCNEAAETEDDHYFLPLMPTSSAKSSPKISKDLKTYKRPQQTITKVFAASPGSAENPHTKLVDDKGALILQESPSCFSPSSSGRATSLIDISSSGTDSNKFLQNDQHFITNYRAPKLKDRCKELHNSIDKSSNSSSSEGPPAKKVKLGTKQTTLSDQENASQSPPLSTDFSFEFSEDEEENKHSLGSRDSPNPVVYSCKHCDYRDGSFRRMTSHYHDYHPYVRCNASYIQIQNDQNASFRCLECPVEFLSPVDLKWHYTEKHPGAADVFKLKLNEQSLVFKCFSCPFTTTMMKALREHYKEKHPTCKLNSPLLFCKYSESKCQDEITLGKTQEKTSSSKTPEKTHTPCKEDKNTSSPQHPTSNGPDVTLYKCSKCGFLHKSAVVMHVHYQKKHPEKVVTIDQIKHSAHSASQVVPETNNKPELSLQAKSALFLPKHTAEAYEKPLDASPTKPVESLQDKSTPKMSSSESNRKIMPGSGNKSSSSAANVYYCQICSYTGCEVRSVLGHHSAKHFMQPPITMKDIVEYSANVRTNAVKSPTPSKAKKQVKISNKTKACPEEDDADDVSVEKLDAYADAEKLFYCLICNFGSPSAQGVFTHQCQTHHVKNITIRQTDEYTAVIREKIKKSKSDRKSFSSTYLPFPLLNDGDEDKIFCDLCNYRNTTMTTVLSHYSKVHHSSANKAADLCLYTSEVLKLTQESAANQKQTEKKNKKSDKPAKTSEEVPSSAEVSETQRKLGCYICEYSTQYLCLLKAHLRKTHNSNRSISEILQKCFRLGTLEAGYYCEWCVFSHKNSLVLREHYLEQHTWRPASLSYIHNRLCAGPKRKKSQLKSAHLDNDTGGSQTCKSSEQNDSKPYPCTVCPFKSGTQSGLTRHNNEVHEKDKLDPLKNNEASAKSHLEDLNNMPGVFESFQMPLEDADEASPTLISQHGLSTHSGTKHLELVNVVKLRKKAKRQAPAHVFKCPHCTYINTLHHGLLGHCKMKHPDLESSADSLYVDLVHLYNRKKYIRLRESGETLKIRGHMCQTCSQICKSLDELNRHCEQEHNETPPSTLKPAPKPSAVSKIKRAKPCSSLKSVSKGSFLSETNNVSMRCQHCSYFSTTTLSLFRHMHKHHADMVSEDSVYKCSVCHLFYFSKALLGRHYYKRHGKAAFLKYATVYKTATKNTKSSSRDHPSTRQRQDNSSKEKRLVYKCPKCPYVNVSVHGVLTHCQMKHPHIEVRAARLDTAEIFVSNIAGCSNGKGLYERGYLCKRCPQMYPSLFKLKSHRKKEHVKKAASELSAEREAEMSDVDDPPGSRSEADLAEGLSTPKTSDTPALQDEDFLYECELCAYSTSFRGYLWKHLKNFHKLNSTERYKLLEKYNRRKPTSLSPHDEHKRDVKCVKCPDLMFDSSESLIDHYNTFHRLGNKSDFTVLSFGVKPKKSTGLYRCAHCWTKLYGTKNLRYHLDRHRAKMEMAASKQIKASPSSLPWDPKPVERCRQGEVSATKSVEELAKQNETSEEGDVLPTSPQPSASKVTEAEPDAEVKLGRLPCKRCHRLFRSVKGLRLHERSHAFIAALNNQDNLTTTDIKKYIFYKTGTLKPFRCSCCSYRSNVMSLVRSHILKNHQDIIQKDNVDTGNNEEMISQEEVEKEPSDSSEKTNLELDEEPEETEEMMYSEPADVQRQLNHYSLMAQITDKTNTNVLELTLPENCLFQCEMCNFNTQHLSSIRRHYMNRHGKKMLRCKDCEFFTCSRKTLEMHVQMGHSTCQSEPTHQKDLRCPFCLYQTKNKNNMIDHIVLHREERVVPIEIRRPKLSRYLQGVVFRCHKCTFSSGSDKSLRLHMMRHDDVKPYQCRLCYFDCTRLTDLEAHLSDKHQVLRNHELVGQVSLDQVEAKIGRMLEENDGYNTDNEEVETEAIAADFHEVLQTNSVAEYDTQEKTVLSSEEAQGKQELDENEESPAKKSSSSDIQDDANPNTTVQKRHEQGLKTEVMNVSLTFSAEGQVVIKTEQDLEEYINKGVQPEDCSEPEKEQTNKYPSRPTDNQEESSSCFQTADTAHAGKLQIKDTRSIDVKVEDDIVQHILLLDENGSKSHKWKNQKHTFKMEPNTEARNVDCNINDTSLDNEDGTTLAQNPKIPANAIIAAKMNQANSTRAQEGVSFKSISMTFPSNYTQLQITGSCKDSVDLYLCKQEQKQSPEACTEASEPCGEMPVLEKECHVEKRRCLETCEEEEATESLGLKQEEEVEMTEDETEHKKQETSNIRTGEVTTTDVAAEVLHEEKPFTCALCGRNLANIAELNRHIVRHRL
ncbi:zinc finger protein 462 [Nematolebias whitei]|uniref:zinc finger protein 462 n=1 Tax=Nematolebias whitei TaxID=451745 RepID=UPI001899340B|nr:zinc finger protein 462 [Nematolebias whitei]